MVDTVALEVAAKYVSAMVNQILDTGDHCSEARLFLNFKLVLIICFIE